ncbi:hypothetical protein [Thermodesulfovibrio sp.]|uniref:hypothetical protein n=1 Tax=Thermodesulfovibrio sp. TaxID=2067987 RepID=UPI0030A25A2E
MLPSHYPQALKNIKIPEKLQKDEVKNVIKKLSQKASTLEKNMRGRIIIRPSGTEPKIRIMVEDENPERLKQVLDELEAVANMMLS